MRFFLVTLFVLWTAPVLAQDFNVKLGAPWDGINVPDGQQCTLFGGQGATPPFELTGLPVGTAVIHVEYNDLSYAPLSTNGGHGAIGFEVSGQTANLASLPGLTADFPNGVYVVRPARSGGRYASEGYLPPCSGGRGNQYSADIIALDSNGVRLGSVTVSIGRY